MFHNLSIFIYITINITAKISFKKWIKPSETLGRQQDGGEDLLQDVWQLF